MILILIALVILIIYHLLTKSYLNPYKTILYIGLPGSGKSTELTKQAILHSKKGWTIYSNMYMPNTIQFTRHEFGYFKPLPNSVILYDEAGIDFDNRKFKNFDDAKRDFLKFHRHFKCKLIFASQSTDVDKKVRDVCDEIWIMRNFLRIFVLKRRVQKVITLSTNTTSDEGTINLGGDIIDKYKYVGLPEITFIPRYVEFFRSFNPPELPALERELHEYTEVQKQLLSTWGYLRRKVILAGKRLIEKLLEVFRKSDINKE